MQMSFSALVCCAALCVIAVECHSPACPQGKVYYHDCIPPVKKCYQDSSPQSTQPYPTTQSNCEHGCACPTTHYWSEQLDQCVITCPEKCKSNMVYKRCKASEHTCQDYFLRYPQFREQRQGGYTRKRRQIAATAGCTAGCACPTDHYWSDLQGKCVQPNQCPGRCLANKVYHTCKPHVQTCKDYFARNPQLGHQVGRERRHAVAQPTAVPQCVAGCACPIDHYWSDQRGECVPPNQCAEKCLRNKVFYSCMPAIQDCKTYSEINPLISQTANSNYRRRRHTQSEASCTAGCACPVGLYWSGQHNQCIKPSLCPKRCKGNKVHYACKPAETNCPDYVGGYSRKKRHVNEPQQTPCTAGCACPPGHHWNTQSQNCVTKCPNRCTNNKVYYTCMPRIQNCDESMDEDHHSSQQNPSSYQRNRRHVNQPQQTSCTAGCACPTGHYWDSKAENCVAKCPNRCKNNKVYHTCMPRIKTCAEPMDEDHHNSQQNPSSYQGNRPEFNVGNQQGGQQYLGQYLGGFSRYRRHVNQPQQTTCTAGCACPTGHYWDSKSENCVTKCPNRCKNNKIYHTCMPRIQNCPEYDMGSQQGGQQIGNQQGGQQNLGGYSRYRRHASQTQQTTCTAGCACPTGHYWDSKSENCVTKCQNAALPARARCRYGQKFYECMPCKKECKDFECGEPYGRHTCPCKPGCACDGGRYWSEYHQDCVSPYECRTENTCPYNLICSSCVRCVTRCPNSPGPSGLACATNRCRIGCKCPHGQVLSRSGRCIEVYECYLRLPY